MIYRILTTFASAISIGFGIWHFFVPKIWEWYSRIDARASELVLAVMITNLFFSLALVLMGVMNILLVWDERTSVFSMLVILSANTVLWVTRVFVQMNRPQGSFDRRLQYGMLATFVLVASLYVASMALIMNKQ
jgi:hypothetical protein